MQPERRTRFSVIRSRRRTLVLLAPLAAMPATLLAQQRAPQLPEVVVTATGVPADVLHVPQSVSVVGRQEIEDHESRTSPEALQEEVGILVQETNFGGGSPFVRAQTGNRILVLIDGVRLNNSTFRFGPNQYLNTVDAQQIERLEVVRGPSSVLYGSDALGGVINVITKRRTDFERPIGINTRLHTQFASAAVERTVRSEIGANYGPLGFHGGVTGRDFDDLRAGSPTGVQDHTGYHELDGDARVQYRVSPDHELAFAFARVTQSDVPNTVAYTLDNEAFTFDPQQRTLYALEHHLHELPFGLRDWHLSASHHQQREVRERQRFGSPVQRQEEDDVKTYGVTSQLARPLGPHWLTSGVEYYHEDIDSSRVDTDTTTGQQTVQRSSFPDGSTYDTFGVFLQDDVRVGELLQSVGLPFVPLRMVLGGRYSYFSIDSAPPGFGDLQRSFDDTTGSVAAVYDLVAGAALVASVSQGFRAPNLDDTVVLRAVPEQGGVDTPNPDLDAERVTNYEGGLKLRLPVGAGSLFYFYSDFSDLIERRLIGFDDANDNGIKDPDEANIFQRQNVGKAVVQGVEGEFLAPVWWPELTVRGNFSWTYGENTTADEPFSRVPPAMGLAGLRYDDPRRPFWIEFFSRVAGTQSRLSARDQGDRRIPPGGTPGWHTVNLRGGWAPFDPIELRLAIENMADEQYRVHGSGIDSPGINVIGSMTCRF
jgi:outer membrane receptor protein involved in Fe transport